MRGLHLLLVCETIIVSGEFDGKTNLVPAVRHVGDLKVMNGCLATIIVSDEEFATFASCSEGFTTFASWFT